MTEIVWKRNRDGLLEAYVVENGKHSWIGIVDGNVYALVDDQLFRQVHHGRAPSETAAMVALVEEYNRQTSKVPV